MYSPTQKALIPLVILPSFVISLLLYRFGKRPRPGQVRTFSEEMELFYSYLAAALLGKFFFETLPSATGPSGQNVSVLVTGFIIMGFFAMVILQKAGRVWQNSDFYVAPEINSKDIRSILDHGTMEINEYFSAESLLSEETATDRLELQDEYAELRKRRRIAFLTLVIMSIISIFEGFFLVYRVNSTPGGTWTLFSFFYVNKLMETLIVNIAMLHALLQCESRTKPYWIWSGSWLIVCVLSTLPVLCGMTWESSYQMVNHLATSIFYAIAGGILFWISLYFTWIDKRKVDRCETCSRLVVYGVTLVVSFLVGFFL
jgi:hypothetical protein